MQIVKLDMETTQNIKSTNEIFKRVLGWIKLALIMAAIVFIVRNVVGITIISGNSMDPTIGNNDVIVSNKFFYTPERNDIVLIQDKNGFAIIKRIIAVPNDTVEILNGSVLINGEIVQDDFAIGIPNDMAQMTVTEDSYFVLGDNRTPGESLDSRSDKVGLIPKEKINGETVISLYPFKKLVNK